jgi:hypothetical protein
MNGLALQVQETLKRDPHGGDLYIFRGRRGQLPTFCIRFSIRDRSLSLASAVRTNAAGLAVRRGKALTCIYTQERPDLCRELPNWMFDKSYCVGMTLGPPEIGIEALNELAAVLAALGAPRKRGAHSRPSNEKEKDGAEEPSSKSRAARPRAGASGPPGAGGAKHAGTARSPGRSPAGSPGHGTNAVDEQGGRR